MVRKITLIWIVILTAVVWSNQVLAARRTALVIGNSNYKAAPLKNPLNDATDTAVVLKRLGFNVILKTDADKRAILKSISKFGKQLKNADVGLFFYAGHGMQVNNINYLIPVGPYITDETDVEIEGVDVRRVLNRMETAENDVNIIFLDACRDNPFHRSFRSSNSGLAKMDAPKGTFIAYATAPGSVAADGAKRNSPFTKHLLKNISAPNLPIEMLLKRVRNGVLHETDEKQMPWQASSLTGNFYFNTSGGDVNNVLPSSSDVKLPPSTSGLGNYDAVLKKRKEVRSKWNDWQGRMDADYSKAEGYDKDSLLTDEEKISLWGKFLSSYGSDNPHSNKDETMRQKARSRLKHWRDRDFLDIIDAYDVERQKSKQVASVSKREDNSSSSPNIINRDGVYVAYANGVVRDKKTGLEWKAGPDKSTNWNEARSWVQSLGSDWRMPTIDELETLYKEGKGNRNMTPLLKTTGWWVWSGDKMWSSAAWAFHSYFGNSRWRGLSISTNFRAFAVRSRGDG